MLVAGSSPRRALVRALHPPWGLVSRIAVAAAAPKGQIFPFFSVDNRGPRTLPSQRCSRDRCPCSGAPLTLVKRTGGPRRGEWWSGIRRPPTVNHGRNAGGCAGGPSTAGQQRTALGLERKIRVPRYGFFKTICGLGPLIQLPKSEMLTIKIARTNSIGITW